MWLSSNKNWNTIPSSLSYSISNLFYLPTIVGMLNTYEVLTVSQKITVKNCESEDHALEKIGMKRDVVVETNLIEVLKLEKPKEDSESQD